MRSESSDSACIQFSPAGTGSAHAPVAALGFDPEVNQLVTVEETF